MTLMRLAAPLLLVLLTTPARALDCSRAHEISLDIHARWSATCPAFKDLATCRKAAVDLLALHDACPPDGDPVLARQQRDKARRAIAVIDARRGSRRSNGTASGSGAASGDGQLVPHGSGVGVQYPTGTVCTTPGSC